MLKIRVAKPTGGKAGKGRNKTSTVQVVDENKCTYSILKQFRFKVGSGLSRTKAWSNAVYYMQQLKKRNKQ